MMTMVAPSVSGIIGVPICFTSIAHDEHDVFVLFGGMDQTGSSLGDTWILYAETLTWSMAEDTPISEESTGLIMPGSQSVQS